MLLVEKAVFLVPRLRVFCSAFAPVRAAEFTTSVLVAFAVVEVDGQVGAELLQHAALDEDEVVWGVVSRRSTPCRAGRTTCVPRSCSW